MNILLLDSIRIAYLPIFMVTGHRKVVLVFALVVSEYKESRAHQSRRALFVPTATSSLKFSNYNCPGLAFVSNCVALGSAGLETSRLVRIS